MMSWQSATITTAACDTRIAPIREPTNQYIFRPPGCGLEILICGRGHVPAADFEGCCFSRSTSEKSN